LFAEDVEPDLVSRTEIWKTRFCLPSLLSKVWMTLVIKRSR